MVLDRLYHTYLYDDILQQEESLHLLMGWVMTWNLCRIDCSCPFCVAGVGRSNYHPVLESKLRRYSPGGGGKSDQNHVDKRILEGKGSQYEDSTSIRNFCPASALWPRCCIDTKRCSCGSTQPEDSTKAQQA